MQCSQPLVLVLLDQLKCQEVQLRSHSDSMSCFRMGVLLFWEPLASGRRAPISLGGACQAPLRYTSTFASKQDYVGIFLC